MLKLPVNPFLFLVVLFSSVSSESRDNNSTLKSVVVVFRHGDRTVTDTYPNDPYANISFWPGGWGQLTNVLNSGLCEYNLIVESSNEKNNSSTLLKLENFLVMVGKVRQYQLGKWFRKRYNDFLPSPYSLYDIRVQSTDVDRTLMSAAAHLAGLYPPSGVQIWDQQLLWQPIPIHTVPSKEDAVLQASKPCPHRAELQHELLDSKVFVEYTKQARNLSEYISKHSGRNVTTISDLANIYDIFFIEEKFGYKLPQWTRTVYPELLYKWAVLSYKMFCYNKPLARLTTGLFMDELLSNFLNVTQHIDAGYQKYKIFSAHDTTITNILMTVGAFNDILVPYASALIFEFRKSSDGYFVKLLYKNSTGEPHEMKVEGCEFDCDFDKFVEILKPVSLNLPTWEKECSATKENTATFDEWR